MATKISRHRGEGHGADYNPWIHTNEIKGHLGTHHNPIDWITGRTMHFLSNGEYWLYLILRFQKNVIDIREQYPLPLVSTAYIAAKKGWRHPREKEGLTPLTTDLLVDYADGHQEAYSVKYSEEELLKCPSQVRNVWMQMAYWEGLRPRVAFNQVYTNININRTYAENIARIVQYWHPETVTDKVSLYMFLLAHKKIETDLKTNPLDDITLRRQAEMAISDCHYPALMQKLGDLMKEAAEFPAPPPHKRGK